MTAAEQATRPTQTAVDPMARLRQLEAEVAWHDKLYFRKASPEISDFEYDELKRELVELRAQFPAESATMGAADAAGVGDDRTTGFTKRPHRVPMLSLEKAYAESQLRAAYERWQRVLKTDAVRCVVEPKFDGLAVSATYEQGKLVRVLTRGNGHEGDDVTERARRITALPQTLTSDSAASMPAVLEVRGEIYLTFAEFERIRRQTDIGDQSAGSTPRNLAAGTLKTLRPGDADARDLSIVIFAIGDVEPASVRPASQRALTAQLRRWGLPVVEEAREADTFSALWTTVEQLGDARRSLPYPTDGVVVKVDLLSDQQVLGASGGAPRWAVAFKFAPERVSTRLNAITIQVGRTGLLTPVAELEPVRIGGAVVSRASLHNADEIMRRDLRIGDRVVVERAGEIIPAVVGVDRTHRDPASESFVFPTACPACGAAAVREPEESAWRCVNAACSGQLKRRLLHFASTGAVGIRGLGEMTIESLVNAGKLRELADLYRLDRAGLLAIRGIDEKSADALLASIAASKDTELWRFIYGLGIPRVGAAASKSLARRLQNLETLAAATGAQLADIEALGGETTRSILAYLDRPEVQEQFAAFRRLGVAPGQWSISAHRLAGKTFVLTGTLPTLTRQQATALIEGAGGKVASTVSRRTTFVVTGANSGATLERAKLFKVPVLDEAGLRRLLDKAENPDEAIVEP